jgi:hypothetical protein
VKRIGSGYGGSGCVGSVRGDVERGLQQGLQGLGYAGVGSVASCHHTLLSSSATVSLQTSAEVLVVHFSNLNY